MDIQIPASHIRGRKNIVEAAQIHKLRKKFIRSGVAGFKRASFASAPHHDESHYSSCSDT